MGKVKFAHLYNEWVKLYQNGLTVNEIAKIYGAHRDTVRKAIINKNVSLRKRTEFYAPYKEFYDEWVELYKSGMSTCKIAELYGCSAVAVGDALKKCGVEMRSPGESSAKYTQFYREWAELYKQGTSGVEIAAKYGCDHGTVMNALKKFGINARSNSESHRRYNIENENAFEVINNEYSAYFLGFIMADGCVTWNRKKNSYRLQVAVRASDIDILEQLRSYLGCEHPLHYYDNHGYPGVMLNISSQKLVFDLIKHGCTFRKSLNLKFPSFIDDNLICHFLRGYFDGDGSITISRGQWQWNVLGTIEFLEHTRKILVDLVKVGPGSLCQCRKGSKIYMLAYGGNRQVKCILDWLYSGATAYLQRKFNKYKQVRDLYGT